MNQPIENRPAFNICNSSLAHITQGSYAPGKSWKALDFFGYNFQVLESPGIF